MTPISRAGESCPSPPGACCDASSTRSGKPATSSSPVSSASSTSSGSRIRAFRWTSAASTDPPKVSGLSHGFQYLTESRGDEINDLLSALRSTSKASASRFSASRTNGGRDRSSSRSRHKRGSDPPTTAAVPHGRQTDLPPARLPRHLHGTPCVRQLLFHRLAPPSVDQQGRSRRQRLHRRDRREAAVTVGRRGWPGYSSMVWLRRCSQHRRSTATSDTGRTRSRPIACHGTRRTAALCSA